MAWHFNMSQIKYSQTKKMLQLAYIKVFFTQTKCKTTIAKVTINLKHNLPQPIYNYEKFEVSKSCKLLRRSRLSQREDTVILNDLTQSYTNVNAAFYHYRQGIWTPAVSCCLSGYDNCVTLKCKGKRDFGFPVEMNLFRFMEAKKCWSHLKTFNKSFLNHICFSLTKWSWISLLLKWQ